MNRFCMFLSFYILSQFHYLFPVTSTAALQDPPAPTDSLEPTLVVPEGTEPEEVYAVGDVYVDPPPSLVDDESSLRRLQKQFVTICYPKLMVKYVSFLCVSVIFHQVGQTE